MMITGTFLPLSEYSIPAIYRLLLRLSTPATPSSWSIHHATVSSILIIGVLYIRPRMSKFKALFFFLTSAGKKYKIMRWRISRSLTAIDRTNVQLFKRTPTLEYDHPLSNVSFNCLPLKTPAPCVQLLTTRTMTALQEFTLCQPLTII